MEEMKQSTLNACCKKLWKDMVNIFRGFPTVGAEVKHIVQLARNVGGEWFDHRVK